MNIISRLGCARRVIVPMNDILMILLKISMVIFIMGSLLDPVIVNKYSACSSFFNSRDR
jgi:hypothetical protein